MLSRHSLRNLICRRPFVRFTNRRLRALHSGLEVRPEASGLALPKVSDPWYLLIRAKRRNRSRN